ncbi:MAG: leucine--tRNA ligase [Myxococcales bacterium]|nr:leucine--tRNA ligase [Myxococcales bacterium]
MRYDAQAVERKWQTRWETEKTFATPTDRTRPKYYVLDMFPYPSGAGLHVGHPKGYVATDVVGRAKRMMGFNVLRVMGWDSFGLPSERQAVREGIHPREVTDRNIATFRGQLQKLGLAYDWDREFATSDPRHYKWTQWIFRKLYEQGLAYQADVAVNWCPALGTVLSNEEVNDGVYVETGDPVEPRTMKQWMFRITEYAERLLSGLDNVDWPASTEKKQREWIGRSEGAQLRFDIQGSDASFEVFTTRPDTLFGCTYVVLAPEHPLVDAITSDAQRGAIAAYLDETGKKSDRDRTSQAADAPKTGAFTGAYAVCPVNGEAVPVWISDYVLASYGTGAVFACPAHDERDHAFARTFGLPIREVVAGGDVQEAAYTGDGPHVNSGFLDGLDIDTAKSRIIAWLEERGIGKGTVNYKLRDWLFSRQRYWGEPFPIVFDDDGNPHLVPESELPVLLPDLTDFTPTTGSDGEPLPPLARAEAWMNSPHGRRETNTMPQWAGSCWYYLRFLSPDRDDVPWDTEEEKYWMPVDLYVGGNEHAVLHLLYARFWHEVLFDLGLVTTPEPFERLFHQGMIHAMAYNDDPDMQGKFFYPHEVEQTDDGFVAKSDGRKLYTKNMKMSKSRYNVSNPDDLCEEHGADALRLYELFMGPLEEGGQWEDAGVAGTRRFVDRVWRLVVDPLTGERPEKLVSAGTPDRDLDRALHAAIKKVTESVDDLRFNTSVSAMMVFVNEATSAKTVTVEQVEAFLRILAPFAPHVAEELWERLGHTESIANAPWPAHDESKLAVDTITLAVQVNGKVRATIEVPAEASKDEVLAIARADEKVQSWLAKGELKREIVVPGRLVNLVIPGA